MAQIPTLLWLWLWQAATALIRPLAWEPPCAAGVALKRQKKKKYLQENRVKEQSLETLEDRGDRLLEEEEEPAEWEMLKE